MIYISQYRASPFFRFPIIDSQMYDLMAMRYARGEGLWDGAFFWPPLYPWLLGVFYSVFGHTLLGVRLVQAVIGAASCVLLYAIGRKVFDKRTGMLAGYVMALYGTLIYFDAEILVPNLLVFLILAGVLIFLTARTAPPRVRSILWLGAGAIHGLAALAVPNILVFLPLAALWAGGTVDTRRLRQRLTPAALLLGGAALVIAPVTIRNYRASGDLVPISSNGGLNFYLGNNANAEATIAIRPGFEWVHLVEEPARAGIVRPAAASEYFFDKGISFLRENPGQALSLYGRKLGRFWNSWEIGRNQNPYGARRHSSLLAVLLWHGGPFGFPFGLIAPLAGAGLVIAYSRGSTRRLLYLFLLAYMVSVLLFFVTARYRIPVVPILILFAAHYVLWAFDLIRARRFRPVLLSCALLVILFPAVNHATRSPDRIYGPEEDRFLGLYFRTQGKAREAEAAYRRALASDSNYADVHAELGELLVAQGRANEALPHLERANALCPFAAQTHYLLGTGYAALGRKGESEASFRRAIAIEDHGEAHRELGIVLLEEGRLAEAEASLVEARRLLPHDVHAWYRLSECYFRRGDYEKTEEALRGALRLAPEDTKIQENLRNLRTLRMQRDSGRS